MYSTKLAIGWTTVRQTAKTNWTKLQGCQLHHLSKTWTPHPSRARITKMFLTWWLNIPHMSKHPDDLSLCLPLLPFLSLPSTPILPHCCWPDLPPSLSMVSLTSSLSSQPRSPVHPHLSFIPTRSVYSRRSSASWKKKTSWAEIFNVQTCLVQLPSHGYSSNPVTNGFLLKTFSRGPVKQPVRRVANQSVKKTTWPVSRKGSQSVSKYWLIGVSRSF